jgi:hypothetical protein
MQLLVLAAIARASHPALVVFLITTKILPSWPDRLDAR